jgi:hypothetical protein
MWKKKGLSKVSLEKGRELITGRGVGTMNQPHQISMLHPVPSKDNVDRACKGYEILGFLPQQGFSVDGVNVGGEVNLWRR